MSDPMMVARDEAPYLAKQLGLVADGERPKHQTLASLQRRGLVDKRGIHYRLTVRGALVMQAARALIYEEPSDV